VSRRNWIFRKYKSEKIKNETILQMYKRLCSKLGEKKMISQNLVIKSRDKLKRLSNRPWNQKRIFKCFERASIKRKQHNSFNVASEHFTLRLLYKDKDFLKITNHLG